MLRKTFVHIPGIGRTTEKNLWNAGIKEWDHFLDHIDDVALSPSKKKIMHDHLQESLKQYKNKNWSFFAQGLPPAEQWRLYPQFKEQCGFLDIETTGLSKQRDMITIIGLYDGKNSTMFVQGKNLSEFSRAVSRFQLLVTYNGACFDLPFIRTKFADLPLKQAHIDLRFVLRSLGYSGGLKHIEKELGIERGEDIAGLSGFDAIRLWNAYRNGDHNALRQLIKYNQADIENLKGIMEIAYRQMEQKTLQ